MTYTVAATVPAGNQPDDVAVDPGSHTVYVTNSKDDTISMITSR